jgi:RND family efflux transporter MFP subunit
MKLVKVILIGMFIAGIIGCEKPAKKEEPAQGKKESPPTAVEAVKVSKGVISRDVRASGVAAGIRESYVVSETQGRIEKVNFTLGQWVKKGHLLVQVNSAIQKAAYEQAKKAASAAELNLTVTEELFNEGSASDAELKNAQSQATGARAQLESTRKAYTDCRILAPISGYIAQKELTIEKGNVLAGGTLVTRIVDISSLKTTVPVGEMEVGILKKRMPAEIKVPAVGNQTFSGKVSAIAAGSDPATGSYPVEVVWKNTKERAIKSGMSVKVIIETEDMDSVLIIPAKSIVEKDRKDAVFLAIDGKAAIRFITPGRMHGNNVEITEGLDMGDIVLTSGMTVLSRGDSLNVTLTGEQGG